MPDRNDSLAAARNHPSKLKSWLTKFRSRVPRSTSTSQIHSQFLSTIPLEIRRQIYTQVLHYYGTVQHILLFNGKLTHMRCASPTSHSLFQTDSERHGICVTGNAAYRTSMKNGWEIVSLLLSCRQIYLEFMEIIYSSIIFRLPTYAAKRLIATVPAPYMDLAYIHLSYSVIDPIYLPPRAWPIGFRSANIKLKDLKAEEARWEALWRAFARLRVRSLLVEILDCGVRVPEQSLLEPLRKVRAGSFEVVLPWPPGLETTGEFEHAGFIVRRPPEGADPTMHLDVESRGPGLRNERGIWGRLRSQREW